MEQHHHHRWSSAARIQLHTEHGDGHADDDRHPKSPIERHTESDGDGSTVIGAVQINLDDDDEEEDDEDAVVIPMRKSSGVWVRGSGIVYNPNPI